MINSRNKMKKNIFIPLIILFLFVSNLSSQTTGSKLINVLDLPEQTIFVDTSSIKLFENQISLLTIIFYKQPQFISALNKDASRVKSQVLFNIGSKKYTVIGSLYYDTTLRILGETTIPAFAAGSDNFSVPLDSSKIMMAVFNKCLEILNTGQSSSLDKDFSKAGEKNVLLLRKDEKKIDENEISKTSPKENERALKLTQLANRTENDSSIKILDAPLKKKEEQTKTISEGKINYSEARDYNVKNETSPKDRIFTDGSLYLFQVSSWKNRSKAESEAKKLKAEGHNAFVSEGYVKGSIWYRVRIGYFNSIEAAEEYMRKVR